MTKAFVAVSLLALFSLTFSLSSCADKMTDRHSELGGGGQGVTYTHEVTPANTDGKGQAMAGGKVNVTPDTMWNQSTPADQKPF